jgi:hypothetical protein
MQKFLEHVEDLLEVLSHLKQQIIPCVMYVWKVCFLLNPHFLSFN